MKTLKELSADVYYKNVEQKTIDLVQDAYVKFYVENDYGEDDLGAYKYEISICLDVYNRDLSLDIEILKNLRKVLDQLEKKKREKQMLKS